MRQQKKLIIIILSIILLSSLGSVFVKYFWLHTAEKETVYIALDTLNKKSNNSIQQGAQLFIEELNEADKFKKRLIKLKPLPDDSSKAFGAELKDVVAVIADKDSLSLKKSADIYQKNSITVINNTSTLANLTNQYSWLYSNTFSSDHQARFIANYTRNVLGHKLVTIIHADSEYGNMMADEFTAVYARFGTKVHYNYSFNPSQAESSINSIIEEIKEKKDLGMIFIAASAAHSAEIVVRIKDAGIRNLLVGTDNVATKEFRYAIGQVSKSNNETAHYTHNLILFTPLLFDTAGMREQNFKNAYIERYGVEPDWRAAYGYESAKLIIQGFLHDKQSDLASQRKSIHKYLNSLDSEQKAILGGASGKIWFQPSGQRTIHTQVGIYNGINIIAAPTQLQPIKRNSSINYIEELKQGKVLYVNDRFMYRTSVIYTGIEMHGIDEVDFEKETAKLDFSIWFRYQGNFDPTFVMFLNAEVNSIKFGEPVEKKIKNGVTYELYDIKGTFDLNFSTEKRQYGSHLIGLSFHHQHLNSNNVIYVADFLGMSFDGKIDLKEKLYSDVASQPPEGWKIDKAWLSQSTIHNVTYGAPAYIGYSAIPSIYSMIDYGILIKEDKFDFRDFVPSEYFIYVGILGLIGSLGARLVDKKLRGYFWLASSWGMRLFFWPLVLVSAMNVSIDFAIEHDIPVLYLEQMVLVFESLGYLMVATLIVIATERFVWKPLEDKTGNKVPGLIRYCVDGLVYLLACFAIVSFVLHQPLSSLLATSGLLAMIAGLAIQGNVANIFSGILISIEKPFVIGDWVKIEEFDNVKIIDMTWRTLRVRDLLNNDICIPNGKVADSLVINYSKDYSAIEMELHLSSKYPPEFIFEHIRLALQKVDGIHNIMPVEHELYTINEFYAEYYVYFMIDDYSKKDGYRSESWIAIHKHFTEVGISFDIYYDFDSNNNLQDFRGVGASLNRDIQIPVNLQKRRKDD